ncbi:MAG: sialidase family protein [Gammaproteobacteria bacterium]
MSFPSVPPWVVVAAMLPLLGVGAILVSGSFDEPREVKRLGKNLPVNGGAPDPADISAHNSPALSRNPRNPRNLVVANRIDSPRFACALHVSLDGGRTWSQTPIPAPKRERACYAPDVAFGADGALHLSFVTLRGRANAPNAVWTASSTDGGRTLSKPAKAVGKLAFQVRLAADPARPKRLYMTWLQASEVGLFRFTEPGNPIRVARSDDGGATWSSPVRVSPPSRERVVAPAPAVGRAGELYVLYLDLGAGQLDYAGAHGGRGGPPDRGPWQLVLGESRDGGTTWKESVAEQRLSPPERFVVFTPPFPSIAVDRDSGRIYAGFYDRRSGDPDVWVWSRQEGRTSWDGPTRVNDTPQPDRTSQYLPKLAVAPDGRLDVLYYDRRLDPRNLRTEVSLQYSEDGGESFSRRVPVSDRNFDSRIGYGAERHLPDLGGRLGLLSTESRAFAVWTDTRGGTRASGKQDLARGVVALAEQPPRLSDAAKLALRLGGALLILAGVGLVAARVSRDSLLRSRRLRT